MVLVDTSVWIRYLAGHAPYLTELRRLLVLRKVCGHDLVYGELLIGDVGGRKKLLEDFERIHRAPTVPHADVVEFVRDRRLHGRGVGWIGAHLLASALVGRMQVWTADPRFATIANELGIVYES